MSLKDQNDEVLFLIFLHVDNEDCHTSLQWVCKRFHEIVRLIYFKKYKFYHPFDRLLLLPHNYNTDYVCLYTSISNRIHPSYIWELSLLYQDYSMIKFCLENHEHICRRPNGIIYTNGCMLLVSEILALLKKQVIITLNSDNILMIKYYLVYESSS